MKEDNKQKATSSEQLNDNCNISVSSVKRRKNNSQMTINEESKRSVQKLLRAKSVQASFTMNELPDPYENSLDSTKIKWLIKVINQNNEEDAEKKKRLAATKKKIWNIVHKIKKAGITGEIKLSLENSESIFQRIVMHPELSKVRFSIDCLISLLLLTDMLMSPFEYFLVSNLSDERYREIIFDTIFFLEIIANFFTAYFGGSQGRTLITDTKMIAVHYIKFGLLFDLLYVFPFWIFSQSLIYMRLIKIYRYLPLISEIKHVLTTFFSHFFKSLKLIHNIVNILLFSINLSYIIHFFSCLYVYIGRKNPDNSWITLTGLDFDHKWELYCASVYILTQTFTTTGYGDLPPQNMNEILYIMFIEIVNVGLFTYLISCIIDIITNFQTDEISFKLMKSTNEIDLPSWMISISKKIPQKVKYETEAEDWKKNTIFDDIQKYFKMFYKTEDNMCWIHNFPFLYQMRPSERRILLDQTFKNFYNIFISFFEGLSATTKHEIALNLDAKLARANSVLIKQKEEIKNLYFIARGSVKAYQEAHTSKSTSTFRVGSCIGDFAFIDKISEYTYTVEADQDVIFLFTIPIKKLSQILSYDERSFKVIYYRAKARSSAMKERTEMNESINDAYFKNMSEVEKSSFELGRTSMSMSKDEDSVLHPLNAMVSEKVIAIPPDELKKELDIHSAINDANLGNMRKILAEKEKHSNILNYGQSLRKKLQFLEYELEFISTIANATINKSSKIIRTFNALLNEDNNMSKT